MRNATRAAVICFGVPFFVMLASPAFAAQRRYEGDDPGPGLTAVETLGLYVGIPLLVIVVVYVLVFATSGSRGVRHRAGVAWQGEPQWWGAPSAADGGTSADTEASNPGGGGARAHW